MLEEMTTQLSDAEGLEKDKLAEEEMVLQPCQVILLRGGGDDCGRAV